MYGSKSTSSRSQSHAKKRSGSAVCKSVVEKNGNMFWGPAYWKTIHVAAASYRPEKRRSFLQWIYAFPEQIPCSICEEHMVQTLKLFPPEDWTESRDKLFLWSYRFHDLVNRSKGDPSISPKFSHVKRYYYEGIYSCTKCTASDS
jgi:hypothetical protein